MKIINLCDCDVRIYPEVEDLVKNNVNMSHLFNKTRFHISLEYSHMIDLHPLRTGFYKRKQLFKNHKLIIENVNKLINKIKMNTFEESTGLVFYENNEPLKNISILDFLRYCMSMCVDEFSLSKVKFLISPSVYHHICKNHKDFIIYFYSPNTPKNLIKNDDDSWIGTAFVQKIKGRNEFRIH